MKESLQGRPPRVAVIGGGIAGLTAALRLIDQGFEVAVFEERIHLGGKLGAHPRRIPAYSPSGTLKALGPGGRWPVRATTSEFSDPAVYAELAKALDAGKVPQWLIDIVHEALRFEGKHLGISVKEGIRPTTNATFVVEALDTFGDVRASTRKRKVPGEAEPDGPHGERSWRVTVSDPSFVREGGEGSAFTLRFEVSLHKREDGTDLLEITDGVYHEHCFHMYLNWYQNFWRLMEDVRVERTTCFKSLDEYVHLFPGVGPVKDRVRPFGQLTQPEDSARSGAAPAPDVLLAQYSVLDLVSTRLDPSNYLDRQSVHGFLASRWYATEASLRLHDYLLARAFAVPSVSSSAYAYQQYLAYTLAQPSPMLWVLKGNSYSSLFKPLEKALIDKGCRMFRGTHVSDLQVEGGRVKGIFYRPADMKWPRNPNDGELKPGRSGPELRSLFTPDYVVAAVPPGALARLVGRFRDAVPGLSSVRRLQTGTTAALDLYFLKRVPDVPDRHVVLRESRLGLSFFDNSQLWAEDDVSRAPSGFTCLNVAVADFDKIAGMYKQQAILEIIRDLQRFLAFDLADVDYSRTYLQLNLNEPLFINGVASEPWRPDTRTEIPNLFLAGDFVDNEIGVACVEGAVVSGLNAARAVQARLRRDHPEIPATHALLEPIAIESPRRLTAAEAEAMKLTLMPAAAAAKAASRALEFQAEPELSVMPGEWADTAQAMIDLPSQAAESVTGLGLDLWRQLGRWTTPGGGVRGR